ncbi:MAG: hypothetical protein H6733_07495 [Alphaproteobacteria bacterium]|nr:hypothetical protein [Alphaproteobacteria bacterium]
MRADGDISDATAWRGADEDRDGDGIVDLAGDRPADPDTDGDGRRTAPRCSAPRPGSRPTVADTDGDALSDGDEVLAGGVAS